MSVDHHISTIRENLRASREKAENGLNIFKAQSEVCEAMGHAASGNKPTLREMLNSVRKEWQDTGHSPMSSPPTPAKPGSHMIG